MSFQSRMWWRRVCVVAAGMMALAIGVSPAGAQARRVPVESLIYDLKNPDPVRRRDAAHELGIAKYTRAIPDLVAMTQDPDAAVRREVELSLEQMDDISTLPGFVRFAGDVEKDIRGRAVDALVNLHVPRWTGPGAAVAKLASLVNLWPDEFGDIVVEPDVPVDSSVVEALRARLADPDRGIRRSASRGLGILRANVAIPELIVAIREDRDDEVRFEAVRALRKIGDLSVGEQILPMLNFNNDKVRNEIFVTIGALRYRPAVPELTRVFEQARPADRGRSLALSALADIADPASGALFLKFKADKDEIIRLYANEGIARLANASQKTVISASRLTEKSVRVQAAQAFALLRTGASEYLDELVRALASPTTRDLAKEYLVETEPAMRPALFAARPEKAALRSELADVFGLMNDPSALHALQELAHDPDSGVARTAERALRRMNTQARSEARRQPVGFFGERITSRDTR